MKMKFYSIFLRLMAMGGVLGLCLSVGCSFVDPKNNSSSADIQVSYDSLNFQDQEYFFRPQLNIKISSQAPQVFLEVSPDGKSWKALDSNVFLPTEPGDYQIRISETQGSENFKLYAWPIKPENFRLRQSIENSSSKTAKNSFFEKPKAHGQSSKKTKRKMASTLEKENLAPAPPTVLEEKDRKRQRALWSVEVGGGVNFLNMNLSSSYIQGKSGGFGGPTLYLSVERKWEERFLKFNILDIQSKMKSSSGQNSQSQNLNWRSAWAGISTPGFWKIPYIEYGISYQDLPLFYQEASGSGRFENGSILAGTLGFNASWEVGRNGIIYWDQRLLIPASSKASSMIEDFKPKFGIDGTVGYSYCINNDWGVGLAWFGQYMQSTYTLPVQGNLRSDAVTATSLNSNIQIRARYGFCNEATPVPE